MKLTTCVLIICFIALVNSEEYCRDDEYDPGPSCGTEPTCASTNGQTYSSRICSCWCKPGTVRDSRTQACVAPASC
ncbi:hypothetical protein O3G_MSEX011709 [Manduca sexta]|uniref:Uncharacterized protein n=1 Tax=Manduca sexta TaxID=7130 RepID=A0A921ZLW3_MANSE|nr:hypothetical protein O3G_MSEX011709 [Manduca sexta]